MCAQGTMLKQVLSHPATSWRRRRLLHVECLLLSNMEDYQCYRRWIMLESDLKYRFSKCDRRHSVDVQTNVTSSSFLHKTPLYSLTPVILVFACAKKKYKQIVGFELTSLELRSRTHAKTDGSSHRIGCIDIILALIAKLIWLTEFFLSRDGKLRCTK